MAILRRFFILRRRRQPRRAHSQLVPKHTFKSDNLYITTANKNRLRLLTLSVFIFFNLWKHYTFTTQHTYIRERMIIFLAYNKTTDVRSFSGTTAQTKAQSGMRVMRFTLDWKTVLRNARLKIARSTARHKGGAAPRRAGSAPRRAHARLNPYAFIYDWLLPATTSANNSLFPREPSNFPG